MTDTTVPPDSAKSKAEQPLSLEIEQNDYSKYLLYSRTEILYVLRAVIQKGSMLTVYFDGGKHFFLTALLTISDDGNWLYFDPGSDEQVNQLALKAGKLVLTTMLDKVKIQFSLSGLQMSQANGRGIFAGRTPDTLLRLQRREYYRLSTPIVNPLKCLMSVPKADGTPTAVDGLVVDISGGGLGLQLANSLHGLFEIGTVLPDCKLNLPDEGLLVTTLCVRNCFSVSNKSGQNHCRVGCEYVDLPGTRLAMIQRYITRIERERKARGAGLE